MPDAGKLFERTADAKEEDGVEVASAIDEKAPHGRCPAARILSSTRSGERGSDVNSIPSASNRAFPIADGTEIIGCSATPRAPYGPPGCGFSSRMGTISRASPPSDLAVDELGF
jgi:hypothetical protein